MQKLGAALVAAWRELGDQAAALADKAAAQNQERDALQQALQQSEAAAATFAQSLAQERDALQQARQQSEDGDGQLCAVAWLGNAMRYNKRDGNRRRRPTLRGRWPRNAMPCNKRGSNRRQRRPALRDRWPRNATATNSSSSSLPAVATPRRSPCPPRPNRRATSRGRRRPIPTCCASWPAPACWSPRATSARRASCWNTPPNGQRAGAVRAGRDVRPGRAVGLGNHGHARRRGAGPATSMPRLWPAASPAAKDRLATLRR